MVDHLKQPMFFGEELNTARYDVMKYPKIDKFTQQQLAYFWRPEEVDLSSDINDFKNKMNPVEKRLYILNLQYQTLLDSVQGRSPNLAFLPIVSLPELETWIETWSFSECLAEGTEVLTSTGWKDLSVTTTEDECLVYNLENDEVFFEKPKRVVEYDVDTDMVEYKSHVDTQYHQLVTPNHRMPVIHRDVRKDGTQQRYFKEALLQDYGPHHLAPVSGYTSKVGKTLTPLDRLKIAVQADGTVSDRYTGARCGTIPAWFNLTKQRKIDRLLELCSDAGVVINELAPDKHGPSRWFKVNFPVGEAGSECLKSFDWVDLKSVSLSFCENFLEELSMWDSHRSAPDRGFTYSTTVRGNADTVQAIASLCGQSPRRRVREDNRKSTYKDLYSISVIKRAYKDGQSISRKLVPYKGKVRCLETSTGAFVIRYNGVVSVTGNTIHSRSYTHIIRNVFDNPSEILDNVMLIPEITERAGMVTEAYDNLIELNHDKTASSHDRGVALFKCMLSVYALEAIRFYVSFACSFSFVERGLMEGNGKVMTLIARDEFLHQGGAHFMLTRWLKGLDDPMMTEIAKDYKWLIGEVLLDTYNQECVWADFLFSEGNIKGLNAAVLKEYLGYLTNLRAGDLVEGLVLVPDAPKQNPLSWIDAYLESSKRQVAPQEVELSSYMGGSIKVEELDLGEFEL